MALEYLSLVMFAVTCGVLLLGFPVAFTLAGVALSFAFVGAAFDLISLKYLGAIPSRIIGVMTNEVLVAVPLFVFMGVMLERSRIAEQLLQTMGLLFGRMRGGLAVARRRPFGPPGPIVTATAPQRRLEPMHTDG